ncbi:MAG TPA: L-arabinose ABC transporter permease AraH [Bacteroidota bacterium]|nr:L-arabinose ABC transporter permease AraH [Bacteroidota bacterium]
MNALAALWKNTGMIAVFFILFALVSFFVPNFFSWVNLNGLALSVATVGIIACTMLFCLAAGDFDLSVGSVVAFAGVLCAVVINATGSVAVGILSAVAAGALVGLVNGVVIARIGINALITTLATMQVVRGFSYIVSDGKAIGISEESFFSLGVSALLGIPSPVWIMTACFIVFGVLLNRTVFGRYSLAIGGNRDAAWLAGIRVTHMKIAIFVMQGIVAAFAGVILASRMTSGQPASGQGLELQVISACVLGGVSLTGGVGTISGVIVGVLIMGTVQNAMNLLNIPPFYQYVASGLILLAAVILDRMKRKR